MSAWRRHLSRLPPASAVAVVSLWFQAGAAGNRDLVAHLEERCPVAFKLLGIATEAGRTNELDVSSVKGETVDDELRAAGIL